MNLVKEKVIECFIVIHTFGKSRALLGHTIHLGNIP